MNTALAAVEILVWPTTALIIVGLAFGLVWRPVRKLLETRRVTLEICNSERQVALQERNVKIEQDRLNVERMKRLQPEQDELDKAKLHEEAARAKTAAEVALAVKPDLIDEEKQVATARTQMRILLLEEGMLTEGGELGADDKLKALELILEAYRMWCDDQDEETTLADWLGDLKLPI